MPWEAIGQQIRTLRERRGLTREQLGAGTALSAVYIKKLEAGERRAPALPTLARIAEALGVTLHVELVEPVPRRRREGG